MSDPLRVAFVVEGPTDYHMLYAVVDKLLGGSEFTSQVLQPEISEAFQAIAGEHGLGWSGVCRWCLQAAQQAGGHVSENLLFRNHDLVIVQLDAEVARENYENGHLQDPFPNEHTLPCEEPCPPPAATTDRLRTVILKWLGEQARPARMALCIPSKTLETWVLVGLFPQDAVVRRRDDIECRDHPERTLQSKPLARRLVSQGKKNTVMYREMAPEFASNWRRVTDQCTEAARFQQELESVLDELNGE